MFGFVLGIAARATYRLRRIMPTNILIDVLRTRRGLKWGMPAMLLALPYSLAAVYCTGLVQAGGPGWLSVLALLLVWNTLKFIVAGPPALFRLLRVRAYEARMRRQAKSAPALSAHG